MPRLTIDNQTVEAPEGVSVLKAAKTAGIKIPTLCYLEDVQAIGACRVCMVEIEGAKTLMASCVTPVAEGMKVQTNSKRVREGRRMVVEMLLSEHDGDCQTCRRSDDCELKRLARSLGIDEVRFPGRKAKRGTDATTDALIRDSAKCIKCRRCVSVCNEVQGVGALFPQHRGFDSSIGPAFASTLDQVVCVQCGQCAAVCPVGAIVEKTKLDEVWKALDDPAKTVVVQTAPAVRVALGECFGYPPGSRVTGKMVAALRRIGFDKVFDTNFTADLTVIEEGMEFLERARRTLVDGEKGLLPQYTSCCPGWIKFAEHFYPEVLPQLSTCKSPQQMFGSLAKTYLAQKMGKKPEDIHVVSVMPCVAKKFESARGEMADSGCRDVDTVLTTRELAELIKEAEVDFQALPDEAADSIMGLSSGAADIFANTGGVMEAALRTVYEAVTDRQLPVDNLHVAPVAGLEGIKVTSLTLKDVQPEWSFLEGVTVSVAVAHGLANARKVIELTKSGELACHFIEIMSCPGGCIGGAGQPRLTTNEIRNRRISGIYREDENKVLRKSHDNPKIKQIYGEFLKFPLGERSHHLLHTAYHARERG
jgi:iron-only hydrogenase group A